VPEVTDAEQEFPRAAPRQSCPFLPPLMSFTLGGCAVLASSMGLWHRGPIWSSTLFSNLGDASQNWGRRRAARSMHKVFLTVALTFLAIEAAPSWGVSCGVAALPSLRGGSQVADAVPSQSAGIVASEEDKARTMEEMMKEQWDYWQSLSEDQQQKILSVMSPTERAAAEAFVANGGKPQMTVSAESLAAWKALSEEEQQKHLATMDGEQKAALEAALKGEIDTPSLQGAK
jgi:hypothetical protein